jgi:hypothetical protein
MSPPDDLDRLSHAELKDLVVKQWEQMVELQRLEHGNCSCRFFGMGWIAQLSLLTSAALDVGLCSASSLTRPPDVD